MTVAAGIQIQGAGQAGPTQGPAQSRMPGAESFRASWQDQLASLSGEAEGRNANAALGTGVPAVRLGGAKGLEAGSAKGAGRQPGGTSSLDRADRNGKTKAAGKGLERTTAEAGTPLAAMLPQIPASEVRNIAQIRIDPGRAEGTASLWGAHPPEDEAAGPLGLSSMVAAGRFASGGDGLTEGTQTAPGARPGETHPARPFESESAGSKGDAPDANGIEARQGSPDDKSGYGSIEIGASGGSEAAAAGRMNAEPPATGPEMKTALSATTDAQSAANQAADGGTLPAAGAVPGSPAAPLPAGESSRANPGLSRGGSDSVQGIKRAQQHTGVGADRTLPGQTQFTAGLGDTSALVRDPAGGREQANAASSGAAAGEPALREPFAALDSDAAPGAVTWTHASARQAEAGFQDPTLGWIGVRADRNGGGVHASLVPGSMEASVELGSHLEGLNGYLTAQHTPVESLRMAAPEGGASGQGAGQNQGQGTGQGEHPSGGQNARQQPYAEARSTDVIHDAERAPASAALDRALPVDAPLAVLRREGASISVVA